MNVCFLPTVAPFPAGISNKSIAAVYTSTCCHPTASIVAVDQQGNTDVCELSAVTQVINIQTDSKYSKLNVIVGETSKLEFNITNLGTGGSFALQISENKNYISYVTPLNIEMDHREVVRCEVVLIGNRETNETRLVVKATPLRKEINTQGTLLLQMSVTVQARKKDRPKPSLELNITADLDPKPILIILYGVKFVLNFTVTNNGLAGKFYFKVSFNTQLPNDESWCIFSCFIKAVVRFHTFVGQPFLKHTYATMSKGIMGNASVKVTRDPPLPTKRRF